METPYVVKTRSAIKAALSDLIDQEVCASWVIVHEDGRKNFEPQISVQEKLEGSPETGKFRVLVNDNTFSYFFDDTVWAIVQDNGKRAVIYIDRP